LKPGNGPPRPIRAGLAKNDGGKVGDYEEAEERIEKDE
jgi:predicted transcriptional regulator